MAEKPTYEETERKLAEGAQWESEEKYRQLFTTVSDAIMLFDAETKEFIDVNDAALKLYGYSKEEFLNIRQPDITAEPEASNDSIKKVLKREITRIPLRYHIKKNGTVFPVEISSSIIKLGEETVLCGVVRDITERKQAEEELSEKTMMLDNILRSAKDIAIATTDLDFRITYYNPMAEEFFGYSAAEVIGKTVVEMHTKEKVDSERFENAIEDLRRDGYYEYLVSQETENGPRYLSSWVEGIFDPNGTLVGYSLFSNDVTEHKRAEEELRKSEKRYRLLAENVSDIIWTIDMNMSPTYYSPSITRLQGFTVEEALDRSIEESMTPASFDTVIKVITEELDLLNKGQSLLDRSRKVDVEFYCKDGSTIWAEVEASFIYDANGQPQGMIGVTRDITERKQADERFKKLHEELEKRVEKRTRDLAKSNKKLGVKTENLEEANTALKVLLKRRGKDQLETEEKILSNVHELITPLMDKLKGTKLDERQSSYMEILETNLKDIVSPFSRKLNSKYFRLAPMQLQVANFIRNGKSTKEIAKLLCVATSTIDTYRDNIRKKLGIKNRKINLKTYLSDLE